jgi:2-polyprenyl-3-methyl-5-hydroxy-6-metoxy-1,4-benzoquinol methylase
MIWAQCDLEELPTCPSCMRADTKAVFTRPDGLTCVECEFCGLAFVNPRPREAAISEIYSADYYGVADKEGVGYQGYSSIESIDALDYTARQRMALIERHVSVKGQRVLEIGCATGEFAHVASKAGAAVTACDYSADAIDLARCRYPEVSFVAGTVEDLLVEAKKFDVVVAFEVIEHVLEPRAWVNDVGRLVDTGGFLILTTPNYECGKSLGLQHWLGTNSSYEHLHFFSCKVLQKLIEENGFSLLSSYSSGSGEVSPRITKTYPIRGVLRKLGLLRMLRKLRRSLGKEPKIQWDENLAGHNLAIVFRKTLPCR